MSKYIPQVFVAPSPQAESSGQPMLVFTQLAENLQLAPILEKNGLRQVEGNQWYPMQSALNVFKALYEDANAPNYDLVAIGMKAMETLKLPADTRAIEDLLPLFDQIAKAFSRHVPNDFGFPLKIIDESHATLTNNTPIPNAAVYGFIWNILNQCKPKGYSVLVRVLPAEQDASTEFAVIWGLTEDGPLA